MEFKYQENIFDAIKTVLLEADKNGRRMHYREIHSSVTSLLGSPISYRKFEEHLKYMVNENLLFKDDPTGKRGSKVYFSLTEKAKRRNTLEILGIDERVRRRRSLYQLLLFFEAIKRRNLLSKRQLNIFLKQIGSSTKNLQKIQETELSKDIQSRLYTQMGIVAFKPIRDVEIMGLVQNGSYKDNGGGGIIDYYYTVLPGFTADEFIQYVEKLKKGKDPRPFSSYPAILHIPFVQYTEYTKQEVEAAIASFAEDGLIKPILEIYPGEKRFDISDKSLKRLIHLIWLVKTIDFYLVNYKLIYKDKLTEDEKNYLALFTGKRASDILIANAYDIRRTNRNQNNNWNEEQESMKDLIQTLENDRKSLVQAIAEENGTMINTDEVIGDLLQSICFLPFTSRNAS